MPGQKMAREGCHQGRKLLKFYYSFYAEKFEQRLHLTNQEVERWQREAQNEDPFVFIQRTRRTRVLEPQEESDLKKVLEKIKREKTENGLRMQMWLIHQYVGSRSETLIDAKCEILKKLDQMKSEDDDLSFEGFAEYITDWQMENQSEEMDTYIVRLLTKVWNTDLFDIKEFHRHFNVLISDIFERANAELKVRLRSLFVLMSQNMEENEEPDMKEWVRKSLRRPEQEERAAITNLLV
ncbi:hypothetical protein CAEBREN_10642 [Caenorhabditis brenneri]|uniref:Uncharacterized protein n=1 Tax=Caenorhabditis brenneri TaxID=135651 RepID=G0P2P0_CAEBE|nr:hypothetical protein CAEBREN_10642 [Caenorhabditis brenneri]